MRDLTKPRVPQINRNHPLTKGLVMDMPFFERGGITAQDILTKRKGALANGPLWQDDRRGKTLNFSAAANAGLNYVVPPNMIGMTKISVEFLVIRKGDGGAGYGAIFSKANGATNRYFHIENDNGTGGWGIAIVAYYASQRSFSIPYWTNNQTYHVVITWDLTSIANSPSVYQDGISIGATLQQAGSGALQTDGPDLYIANVNNATQNWDGNLGYMRWWNRILTPQEAKQLYINPWQMYTQPSFLPALDEVAASSGTGNQNLLLMGVG